MIDNVPSSDVSAGSNKREGDSVNCPPKELDREPGVEGKEKLLDP